MKEKSAVAFALDKLKEVEFYCTLQPRMRMRLSFNLHITIGRTRISS